MIAFVRPPPGTPTETILALAEAGFVPDGPDAPWVVVHDPDEIGRTEGHLWLRGLEAGGPTGHSAAVVSIRAAVASGQPWVAEGLSARGMAAALAVGAAGIVIDAPLWLARESPLSDAERAAVRSASSGHDTTLSGELEGTLVRSLVRGAVSLPAPQNVADARAFDGVPMVEIARAVLRNVEERRARIADHHPLRAGLDPLRTGVPIVQGPMANVAEGTGLARSVRAAGAMPFAALGALDPAQAGDVLRAWADDVPAPWGVGIIGFDVMPYRDAHLAQVAALGARGPAAVILAGASPALALQVAARGAEPWLHTPSGRLVEQALGAGVPVVVLEGHEAGGHVGRLTSVGLWEDGLAAAERFVDGGGKPPTVVLAGGIGDAVSAAFAAAMAADAASRGIRIVLQAGTAFLLTHEAAESGQVTPLYQARALAARRTVLVGSTVNLPLRCVPSVFTDEARAREIGWEADGMPRAERRQRLEHHNLGRTRVAAKGIERNPDSTAAQRYRPVPVLRQDREGAFTVGQGATVTDRLCTVAELTDALSRGAAERLGGPGRRSRWGGVSSVAGRPSPGPAPKPRTPSTREGDVAVIGLGCVLPGALDVPAFYRNLIEGKDALGAIPPDRWEAHRYYDPSASGGPARTYTRHAGVVRGFRFDPLPFRIPPRVVPTIDPSQRMALVAAAEAVRSAGLDRAGFDRKRAAVVLGNAMGGEFAKSLALRVRFREVVSAVGRDALLGGLGDRDLAELEARVEARMANVLPPIEFDTMSGLLSNVVAGRVAAWLDWMGGNLTVDAACAASLAAVSVAVDWLRMGRCDVVLAGGVDTDLSPETFVGFCRTQALSHGRSAPFSTRADGFVMGEGAAVLALKRLSDAERDGDAVWAVIRGVGISSDGRGRGITAPRAEGQALAIERAYAESDLEPRDLGMVEAHGTGTALGDATEVGVLAGVFAHGTGPTWLGSVKSMIGHLKSAAGAASLVKTVLALRTGVIPPTLRAGPIQPDLGLDATPFRLPRAPTPFPDGRLRASVSAFGFGGTNYHVILDAGRTSAPPALAALQQAAHGLALPASSAAWQASDDTPLLLAYGAETDEALRSALAADRPSTLEQTAASARRLVILADPDKRVEALQRAARWLATAPRPGAAVGRELFYGAGPAEPVVVAFPGQGAQRLGAVDAVRRVPAGARALAAIELAVRVRTGDARGLHERERDESTGRAASDPLSLHLVLYGVQVGWAAVLRAAGIPIAAVIGHSLGAYAALVAAGAADAAELLGPVQIRGQALADCPPGAMLAVRLGEEEATAWASRHDLKVAAVNGAERSVLAGPTQAIGAAAAALGPVKARAVDVRRAYHSPMVAPAADAVRDALHDVRLSPSPLVWSARTGDRPTDLAGDLVAGIVEPVRFDPAVRAMLAEGHRLWVEAGPGTTLCRIVEPAGGTAIPLDPSDAGGIAAAAAALLAAGHAGLAALLPGTLVEVALAAVVPAPERPVAEGAPTTDVASLRPTSPAPIAAPVSVSVAEPDLDLAARADAVQDLRLASLADPSLVPTWRAARTTLLHALARRDAGLAPDRPTAAPAQVATGTAPAQTAQAPVPVPAAPRRVPVAPADPSPALSVDSIRDGVTAVVCEVTGYPSELVREGADLEADLGVDSIRKMEILGLLEQRFGFTTAESDYADLAVADLGVLVAHVRKRTGADGDAAPDPVPATATVPSATATGAVFAVPIRRLRTHPQVSRSSPFAPRVVTVAEGRTPADVVRELASSVLPDPLIAVLAADAGGAAAAGWLRSAARELSRELRLLHVVGVVSRERVAAELASLPPGETWLDAEGSASESLLVVEPRSSVPLPRGAVILATGGVRGILLPCLAALAASAPRVVLLGRTPPGDALDGLRAAGIEVVHVTGDVTVEADVRRAADTARRWGRIEVVIHGAGLLHDGPIGTTSDAERDAVLAVKLDGAARLVAATMEDAPALFCTFSSVVARLGNAAQTTYGAANAALATLVHPTAARSVTIGWTAWSGVGMAADPRLQALLASRGVRSLTPEAGAEAFRRIVCADGSGRVEITAQPLPDTVTVGWPLGAPHTLSGAALFPVPLDPRSPPLSDHQVGGRPLVPAAWWLAAAIEAARVTTGREGAWLVEGMEILAPTFVDRLRDDVVLSLAPSGALEIRSSSALVCRARITACADPTGERPPVPLVGAEPAGPLYRPDLLFHGPVWQVLRNLRTDNGTAEADLLVDPGPSAVASAVDGVHQVLSAWSGQSVGWLGLPVGADRWIAAGPADGALRIETRATTDARELRADVLARDPQGRVVLWGQGIRLRAASRGVADA